MTPTQALQVVEALAPNSDVFSQRVLARLIASETPDLDLRAIVSNTSTLITTLRDELVAVGYDPSRERERRVDPHEDITP